jgi:glycosyltransferase involved in cell wall biosynthesis
VLGGTLGQLVVVGQVVLRLHSLPLSLLFSAEGAGAVLGAALAGRAGRRWSVGAIILAALPVTGLSVLGLSAAPDLLVACAALAVFGTAETVMFVNLLALRQRTTPGHMQGRVNATGRALAVAGTPGGALLAGVLVGPLGGIRAALAVLGGIALLNAGAADEEMPALVAESSVLAMVSAREGFGLAGMEALAAGVPVVARDLPVLREVYGDTVVFAEDVPGIAAALARQLSAPLPPDAGRALAASYTWKQAATAHLAAYQGLLA